MQRYVLLACQIALSIALSAPSFEFGERVSRLVLLQLGDQSEHVFIELHLRDGQCGIAADQRAGSRIGGEAIEIRIVQYFDAFLGFLQQAIPDGLDVPARNILPSKDAATGIAVSDPFGVFLDREAASLLPPR